MACRLLVRHLQQQTPVTVVSHRQTTIEWVIRQYYVNIQWFEHDMVSRADTEHGWLICRRKRSVYTDSMEHNTKYPIVAICFRVQAKQDVLRFSKRRLTTTVSISHRAFNDTRINCHNAFWFFNKVLFFSSTIIYSHKTLRYIDQLPNILMIHPDGFSRNTLN